MSDLMCNSILLSSVFPLPFVSVNFSLQHRGGFLSEIVFVVIKCSKGKGKGKGKVKGNGKGKGKVKVKCKVKGKVKGKSKGKSKVKGKVKCKVKVKGKCNVKVKGKGKVKVKSKGKGKDKAIPVQALKAPRRLKLPEFLDSRDMKVISLSTLCTGRLDSPRKYFWYTFLSEAELTPGPQCGRKD